MHDLATVMYTSGTTDEPKGIVFNQENIVTKRFARALALPDFSCDDIFLCFLPLYHTFGRYFELLGSIFWGATYTFAESPYFKSLLKDFHLIKPSVFISVPKRWIQLMEHTDSIKPVDDGDIQEIVVSFAGTVDTKNLVCTANYTAVSYTHLTLPTSDQV